MLNTYITFKLMMDLPGFWKIALLLLVFPALCGSCKREKKSISLPVSAAIPPPEEAFPDYDTTLWTELKPDDGFVIDIRYATTDNFVKEVIYPCGRMFLRPEVAAEMLMIRDKLKSQGYRLKLFDGYRPRPAQQKLWDKVPNPDYVAPPAEGSMHNRGVAIDLTLTDPDGNEIEMGTPYDFFGPEAHHDYTKLSGEILGHRQKLKAIMEEHGFQSIRTEWWHYSYTRASYPLDQWQWNCKN